MDLDEGGARIKPVEYYIFLKTRFIYMLLDGVGRKWKYT